MWAEARIYNLRWFLLVFKSAMGKHCTPVISIAIADDNLVPTATYSYSKCSGMTYKSLTQMAFYLDS